MPIHVVHIEDDRPLRDILRIALTATDSRINLHQFTTGSDALPYIETNRLTIDLFILDIRLPGTMNGIEIAKKIRELDCPGSIVLASAYGTPTPELLASLRSEYFPKPWHIPEIIAKVFSYQMVAKPPEDALSATKATTDTTHVKAETIAEVEVTKPIPGATRPSPDISPSDLPGTRSAVGQTSLLESSSLSRSKDLVTVKMVDQFTCYNCGNSYRRGELVCTRCGTLLVEGSDTRQLGAKGNENNLLPGIVAADRPPGTVFSTPSKHIVFLIDGREVFLPVKPIIFVGRRVSTIGGTLPIDVDLSLFQAAAKGVSRRHLQITAKDSFVYVTDLAATNGTRLNGRFIDSHNERLLRDGDELQLGTLRIRVRFE